MSGVVIVSLLGLSAWGVVAGVRADRRNRRARSLIDRLRNERQPLYCVASSATWFQVETVSGSRSPRRPFVVEVCEDCLTLYPLDREAAPEVVVRPENLRWFGRPRKYHPGTNEIWLDVEIDGEWRLIKVRLTETHMRGLVRALKEIASEEQISAYRRRRLGDHFDPSRTPRRDMLGAWTLSEPLALPSDAAASCVARRQVMHPAADQIQYRGDRIGWTPGDDWCFRWVEETLHWWTTPAVRDPLGEAASHAGRPVEGSAEKSHDAYGEDRRDNGASIVLPLSKRGGCWKRPTSVTVCATHAPVELTRSLNTLAPGLPFAEK